MAKQTKGKKKTARTTTLLKKPPSQKHLARGRRLAVRYRLVINKHPENGFWGSTVEMPMVLGSGATIEKCAQDILDATAVTIAVELELGQRPPTPASEGKRNTKIVVMVTADDASRFGEESRRQGFARVSDFLRSAGLKHV